MTGKTKPRHILFVTATRADLGKLKPLIAAIEARPDHECTVFATGMHTLELYGYTIDEVRKAGFRNIHVFHNQIGDYPMDLILAETVKGLSHFVHQAPPDLIVVHGDRVEALAGAIVGALRNILVVHIEGGEISGTVDELIRHSVSKLAHLHFVANEEASTRLRQMGENPESIFVIGSPDMDVMVSPDLPTLETVCDYYDIAFDAYSVAIFHPVTTELPQMPHHAAAFVDALLESQRNYVVVFPNNDTGTEFIQAEYKRLMNHPRFRVFRSLRFEYFLTLLKNTRFIIGNSSAGIREANFYGRPAVNVGSRQSGRFQNAGIIDVGYAKDDILQGIVAVEGVEAVPATTHFGDGNSRARFLEVLDGEGFWERTRQKQFVDLSTTMGTIG